MDYYKNLSLENLTCYDKDGNYHVEQWIDMEGCIGYCQVSTFGRVKSLERITSNGHHRKEYIRTLTKDSRGYLQVGLYQNNKVTLYLVHRIVAKAFIKNPSNLPDVNHIDLIKTNCCVWNLEWMTERQNVEHYYLTQNSSSKYIGVWWDKSANRWRAEIKYNKKKIYIGIYKDEDKAGEAYRNVLKQINDGTFAHTKKQKSSKFKGVIFRKDINKWTAVVCVNKKQIRLGSFITELEAHEAYQKKIIELGL